MDYDDLDGAVGRRRAERWQQAEAIQRASHAAEAPQRALQQEMTASLKADFERRDRNRVETVTMKIGGREWQCEVRRKTWIPAQTVQGKITTKSIEKEQKMHEVTDGTAERTDNDE